MKPYYQDEAVTIYHGDCRETVPSLGRFDLLLTDPPYGMNFQSNYRIEKHDKIKGDLMLPVDLIEMAIASVTHAAYVFCRWDNLSMMPPP